MWTSRTVHQLPSHWAPEICAQSAANPHAGESHCTQQRCQFAALQSPFHDGYLLPRHVSVRVILAGENQAFPANLDTLVSENRRRTTMLDLETSHPAKLQGSSYLILLSVSVGSTCTTGSYAIRARLKHLRSSANRHVTTWGQMRILGSRRALLIHILLCQYDRPSQCLAWSCSDLLQG
ncbi:hypothetical protein IQ07DRAFT_29013 [Pyrenochaeta sp. DS3sAY3a]|nr:hypothetical protein IQ07DRAFT_29013 [Pyrenochaeta sp. DS3sAY3a]